MIVYQDNLDGITPDKLGTFFVGWPSPPSPETHLRILRASAHVVLAVETDQWNVVGFINALSDGVLSAYVPLLEVLPSHQGQGIGTELFRRMLEKLRGLYNIDLLCDIELRPFYARFGMRELPAMALRNYGRQSREGQA